MRQGRKTHAILDQIHFTAYNEGGQVRACVANDSLDYVEITIVFTIGFSSNGTSDSMISNMQIEPAVPLGEMTLPQFCYLSLFQFLDQMKR